MTTTRPEKTSPVEQERFELRPKSGGGLLSYEVWVYHEKGKTVVTRYNLAYINHSNCHVDNGRVLGFDNAHDDHHRHDMGKVTAVEFNSYEATLETFQQEWLSIAKKTRGKKSCAKSLFASMIWTDFLHARKTQPAEPIKLKNLKRK